MVFVAPEPPITPLGTVPEASDPRFAMGELPAFRRSGHRPDCSASNFLDMAHFPFVHAATFGAGEAGEVPPYTVARDGWSFTAAYEHQFAHREDPGVAAGARPLIQTRRLTYRFSAPFHLRLRIDFIEAGGSNVIGLFIQPETAERCRLFTTLWRDDLDGVILPGWPRPFSSKRPSSARTFGSKRSYRDLVLPLDPRVEVHTRADRITLELRRSWPIWSKWQPRERRHGRRPSRAGPPGGPATGIRHRG